jgi:hypothetical protein
MVRIIKTPPDAHGNSTLFDVTEYAHGAFDRIKDERGIIDAFRPDFVMNLENGLQYYDGRIIGPDSEPVGAFIDKLLSARPHWLESSRAVTDEEDACFNPDNPAPKLKSRGEYIKRNGIDQFEFQRERWRASNSDLSQGVRPADSVDKTTPKKEGEDLRDARANPWRNLRTAEGTIDKRAEARCVQLIASLGHRAAAGLAKAAGVGLDGRPLRK